MLTCTEKRANCSQLLHQLLIHSEPTNGLIILIRIITKRVNGPCKCWVKFGCNLTDISLNLADYLELVDWSGRIIREDKRGHIPDHLPNILQRLDVDARHWLYLTRNFEQPFKNLVGAAHHVRKACEDMGKCWVHGISQCEKLFSSS